MSNTYKPYPCGIVSHPAIEAAETLHRVVAGHGVERAELRCHPLVVELTGNPEPTNGLQPGSAPCTGSPAGCSTEPST